MPDNPTMAKTKRTEAFTEMQRAVGVRIGWARELVYPNQAEFARLIGVDQSTLNKIEAGDRAPNIFIITEVSNRLRVSTDFLLKGTLVGRTDEEMALRLGAMHPELASQLVGTDQGTGTGRISGRLPPPKTPFDALN